MKFRIELTRQTTEYSHAETVIEAASEAEASRAAQTLTDWDVEFPEKNLDVEVEYHVGTIKEVA